MVQTVNVTVDNVSPLISYLPSGAWYEGDQKDQYLNQYFNKTYTQTTQLNAYASLSFNGTAAWIYGAKRLNHGMFNATIDGAQYYDNGYSATNLFQQVLFTATPLYIGTAHTVTIIDASNDPTKPYLDVDRIVYSVQLPDGYHPLIQQDNDLSAFKYTSSWSTNPDSLANYSSGTGHTTSSSDAYVTYTFEGAHVEIYGTVGPSYGNYAVQIDDDSPVTFNGTNANLVPQTLLYQNCSFVPGKHQVKISNSGGQTLSIDYALIYTLKSPPSSSPSGGTIGGAAVGACAVILLILFGVFFWWRRRRRRQASTSPGTPLQTIGTGPVISHVPTLPATVRHQPSALSASTDPSLLHPVPSPNQSPSPPQSSSSASNTDSRSRLILHNPSPSFSGSGPDGAQGSLQELLGTPENPTPHQNPGQATSRPLPRPGQSNPQSRSTTFVLAPAVSGDIRAVRMQVEGRSQDLGPITFIADPEHDGNLLPPDYIQATQPFPSQQPQQPQQ